MAKVIPITKVRVYILVLTAFVSCQNFFSDFLSVLIILDTLQVLVTSDMSVLNTEAVVVRGKCWLRWRDEGGAAALSCGLYQLV